ncbi:cryptochrome/photolyase family protein [Cognatishimia activa]|uniref:Deoxyribodipyrimidine photo-lyase n=1 Tax=Cognatishimia activa TaxID=1715691 RepID=A0A975EQR7_9RHOB|nr:deoxyribodipyrimidine photo-lyase [Cognatishimia activa]QTN36480.1 deoxyribodipyrimidine photo-lyase [Cognatishimia activa]
MRSLVLFRNDLRVADNPALTAAAARGEVLPVFVYEPEAYGEAAKWWLHHSLNALAQDLGGLLVRQGDPLEVVEGCVADYGVDAVFWNRRYEPAGIAKDTEMKAALGAAGVTVESFPGNLLFEPWQIKTGSGGQFKVFSPFWRACLKAGAPAAPLERTSLAVFGATTEIDALDLLPTKPDWATGFGPVWTPGEKGAWARLEHFLSDDLKGYKTGRDRPDQTHVSRLSPHLHFGEISPRQIWREVQRKCAMYPSKQGDADKFLAEIGWREFSHQLLFHTPDLPEQNLNRAFDAYPWADNPAHLAAWQKGKTGYPLVDAGMRELWHTGYMHNRVRMVVASFLIKHLRIHWQHGMNWFWDTLLDADLANNTASWQWVAGSGADAAPYFRIFNPTTQAQKFDPNGDYIRKWCPELAALPTKVLHAPWEAPALVLQEAGVTLGETYPHPIVDHKEARAAALAGYEAVKASQA